MVPINVIVSPIFPLGGENDVMVETTMVKEELVAVPPLVATVTAPVEANDGTVTVSLVEVAAVTVAGIPSKKLTVFCAGVVSNPVPMMSIVSPTLALVMALPPDWKPVICGITLK
jgi:F0F1-type ATP synthase membrane subunit a